MKRAYLAILLGLTIAIPSFANDQEKAIKQVRMMTALSRDEIVRAILSRTFADSFKIDRSQLVAERKAMGLNYGALFLAHELVLSGCSAQQIEDQVRAHQTMLEIANSVHADWKHIASDAKKMNNRVNDGIYKHFLHAEKDKQRDQEDHYVASADLVRSDAESTAEEILSAQTEYLFWRNLAAPKTDDPADRSTPLGKSYEQSREDVAITHGNTPPGPLK